MFIFMQAGCLNMLREEAKIWARAGAFDTCCCPSHGMCTNRVVHCVCTQVRKYYHPIFSIHVLCFLEKKKKQAGCEGVDKSDNYNHYRNCISKSSRSLAWAIHLVCYNQHNTHALLQTKDTLSLFVSDQIIHIYSPLNGFCQINRSRGLNVTDCHHQLRSLYE